VIWPWRRCDAAPLDVKSERRRDAISDKKTDLRQPLDAMRWCVVDVETGGLDAERDPLLAIGAVAIEQRRILLAPSLEVGLMQQQSTAAANILVHGISGTAQREGEPPHEALLAWLEFAGAAPRVAFHAAFDQTVLARDERRHLGRASAAPWFDTAVLAPLLFPAQASSCRTLDDWLAHFGITVYTRHGALADAYATAELWLVLLDAAVREGVGTAKQLYSLGRERRWLSAH
jgi:DNA polymerase-3 subunit epsilon